MPDKPLKLPDFPYRFDLLIKILRRFVHPARQVIDQDTLWRVTNGQLVSYAHVDDELVMQTAVSEADPATTTISQHILGLNQDLSAFYAYAEADPILWQVIEPLVGLPIFRTETVFEALITLIIEQHISWKNALRSQHTLMEIFDTGHAYGDLIVYDFPTPTQLSQATVEQLKPLKITNRRMAMMIQIAEDVVNGDLDLESIREMDMKTGYDTLMKIKGVGHWTANNVLSRALGLFPYISHNDVALQAAVLYYFHQDDGKKSAQQTIDTLVPYGDYAGLVGHFTLLRWVLDKYEMVN